MAAGPRSRQPMAAAAAAAPPSPPQPIAAAAANLPTFRPPLAAPWAEMRPRRRSARRKTSGFRPTLGELGRIFPSTVRTTCQPPPSLARARSRAGMIYAVFSPFCFCCGREKSSGCSLFTTSNSYFKDFKMKCGFTNLEERTIWCS